MRVLMAAFGSRGDVLPRLALGLGLEARGHQVTLACPEQFRGVVESCGPAWVRLGHFPSEAEEAEVLRVVMHDPDPGRRGQRLLAALFEPMLPGILQELAVLGNDFDLVTVNDLLAAAALPNSLFTPRRLAVTITSQPIGGLARMLRASPWPKLVGSNPILLPPAHGLASDFELTDFWLVDDETAFRPDPDLESFLSEGTPSVAVTLGSAGGRDPYFRTEVLHEAAARAGMRMVLQDLRACPGRSKPIRSGSSTIVVGELPYSWLFRRVDCVVHHGGAGTVAEALRAGRPSIALPQYGDQWYWSLRLEATGASAGTLLPDQVTAVALTALMTRAKADGAIRAAAARLGEAIDPSAGIARACGFLEELVLDKSVPAG